MALRAGVSPDFPSKRCKGPLKRHQKQVVSSSCKYSTSLYLEVLKEGEENLQRSFTEVG